ncbi:MAG: iron ABC transporter permease [Deltaproteobacteria bacterium]|nr:iron ABC transporter permease [Deltaproteobacteria bacterium]
MNSARSNSVTHLYNIQIKKKQLLFFLLIILLALLCVIAIAAGSYNISVRKIIVALLGQAQGASDIVVWSIRMPRIVAAIVAGWSLGLSGVAMQSLLKNPLAAPSTLGISHGAAFGAAVAIVTLGAGSTEMGALHTSAEQLIYLDNIYSVSIFAFLGAIIATVLILFLAVIKRMAPEAIILAGVAFSSLFVSGTILIQYFADEVELAAIVFWTFGDVARSNWQEIAVMSAACVLGTAYFVWNRWNLNALSAGEDAAKGLGVDVNKIRLSGMFVAALLCSLAVAFHGVIAFLGLLAPHIGRRFVGADHRFLIPYSCVLGALLLLLADTVGRTVIGSGTLPVGVLTSFMGAPLFLYLLLIGQKR